MTANRETSGRPRRLLWPTSACLLACFCLAGCTIPAPTPTAPVDTPTATDTAAAQPVATPRATPREVIPEDSGSSKGAQGQAELIATHEYRYVVASNDTLWDIRQRFGVCNADIQPYDIVKPELGTIHELVEGETVRIKRVGTAPLGSDLCEHGGS